MKVVKIKCPNCSASIEIEKEGKSLCPYCGAAFFAETQEEQVIINTTINNYAQQKGQASASKTGKAGLAVALTFAVSFVAVAIFALLLFAARIMPNQMQADSDMQNPEFVYKTAVESEPMQVVCERIFKKSMAEISEADYASVTSLTFRDGYARGDILSRFYEVIYELEDGSSGSVKLSSDSSSIPLSDFQPFQNLKSLMLCNGDFGMYDDMRSYTNLKNLSALRCFQSDIPAERLSEVVNAEQITELTVNYANDNTYAGAIAADFTNLQELTLRRVADDVTDFDALGKLTGLSSLTIENVRSNTNLNFLSALPNLTSLSLDIHYDSQCDISPLYALTGLTNLHIRGGCVKNMGFLSGMERLEALYVNCENVLTLDMLADHTALRKLDIYDIGAADLSVLARLPSLEKLSLPSKWTEDDYTIPDLTGLAALKEIELSAYDLGAISGMPGIESVNVDINTFEGQSLVPLTSLPNLTELKTCGNSPRVSEPGGFSALAGCPSLKSITIGDGTSFSYTDIAVLINIPTLEYLDIGYESHYTINPDAVSDNDHLKTLILSGNDKIYLMKNNGDIDFKDYRCLDDISHAFAKLHAIETLEIPKGKLSSLDFASELTSLRELDITDNYVENVLPLVSLPDLSVLRCEGNPILNMGVLPENVLVIRD